MKDVNQWSGLSDLLSNLISKYAEVLDFDSMPIPETSKKDIEMTDCHPKSIASNENM